MAEAQGRTAEAAITISALEKKATQFETESSRYIDENNRLSHALEGLNANLASSEGRVKGLQEELDASHAELSRITGAVLRLQHCEALLGIMEAEQEELRNTITTTQEEKRAATVRWRKAERQVAELELRLENIERDYVLELRKYNTRRVGSYPVTLGTAGAFGQFVKEIQSRETQLRRTNSFLQLGVTELRDMLVQSQEEVDILRGKLQNLEAEQVERNRPSLSTELSGMPAQNGGVQTVVHHHHYHATPPIAPKSSIRRLPRKKKVSMNAFHGKGLESTSSGPSIPHSLPKRWSSSTGLGPLSSSPTSTFEEASIFDRLGNDNDTSRPTSADSNHPHLWKKGSDGRTSQPPFTILHATEEIPSEPSSPGPQPPISPPRQIPVLKRSVSYESILTIPAMDTTAFFTSPALSRSPNLNPTTKPNDAQAAITPGVAVQPPGNQWSGTAYSRLLDVYQDSSSLPKSLSGPDNVGGGWFWKYVSLTPGPRGKTQEPARSKKFITKPTGGYVNEELLRESLLDGLGPS